MKLLRMTLLTTCTLSLLVSLVCLADAVGHRDALYFMQFVLCFSLSVCSFCLRDRLGRCR